MPAQSTSGTHQDAASSVVGGSRALQFGALDYVTEERAPKPGVFELGLALAGGVSAGAMVGAITAVALKYRFIPAAPRASNAQRAENPFYATWVNAIDIDHLLGKHDLTKPGNATGVASLLDSSVLQTITDQVLSFSAQPVDRPYVQGRVRYLFTQASLQGAPYFLHFRSMSGGIGHHGQAMMLHRGYRSFSCTYGSTAPSGRRDDVLLSPDNSPDSPSWQALGMAALGSGAFPIGLAAVRQVRSRHELDYYYLPHYTLTEAEDGTQTRAVVTYRPLEVDHATLRSTQPDGSAFTEYVVDGGTMNNEPFGLARKELAGLAGRNPRDAATANRAVVMVDPFPSIRDTGQANGSSPSAGSDVVSTLFGLMAAWKNQSRFSPEDMVLAWDDDTYSRFMIAPVRGEAKPVQETAQGDADAAARCLASAPLDGFGGFLDRSFRHHDFMLGRRNCQQFLRHHFVLDRNNALFGGNSLAARGEAFTHGDMQALPIIPLMPSVSQEEPLPPWPSASGASSQPDLTRITVDAKVLEGRLKARMRAVVKQLGEQVGLNWPTRFAISIGVGAMAKKAVGSIVQSLDRHQLRPKK